MFVELYFRNNFWCEKKGWELRRADGYKRNIVKKGNRVREIKKDIKITQI